MRTRVMVYSHDTFGLGNIRRMLAVCEHLLENAGDISVLLVTGSPMVHEFRLRPGLDYIKLPCVSRVGNDEYYAKSLRADIDQVMHLRSALVLSAAMSFDPDIALIDKKPDGVRHELRETLQYLRENRPGCRIALVLRDILDAPDVTIAQWRDRNYERIVCEYFHAILILGSPDVFDAVREYKFSQRLRRRTSYTGYVQKTLRCQDRKSMPGQFRGRRTVLVTSGGGEDGFALVAAYVQAAKSLHDVHSVIVSGPEMPSTDRENIARLLGSEANATLTDFSDDLMGLMSTADVVVSMAGYNTICEILSLNKRAVTVPRVRPVQEQWIRASRLAHLGLIRTIHPDALTPKCLADAVRGELHASDEAPPRLPRQNGLASVTRWVQQNSPLRALGADYTTPEATWHAASLTF